MAIVSHYYWLKNAPSSVEEILDRRNGRTDDRHHRHHAWHRPPFRRPLRQSWLERHRDARDPTNAGPLEALAPAKIIQLDTGDEESILSAAKQLEGTPIDLLINNAGIEEAATFETATKANFMRAFEVNAVGTFLVTRAFVENLRLASRQRGSSVVANISSMSASITVNTGGSYTLLGTCGPEYQAFKVGIGGRYPYRASKVAVNMILTSLASDLRPDNIIIVAIQPGVVKTDLAGDRGLFLVQVAVTHVQ